VQPVVDADVHAEYWSAIRGLPVPPRADAAGESEPAGDTAPAALHAHFNSVV